MAVKPRTRILHIARRQRRFHRSDSWLDSVTGPDLQALVDEGTLVELGRGWYALATLDPGNAQTLEAIARRVPRGFFCLLTALRFHGMTDEHPAEVWVAMDRQLGLPHIDVAPVRFVRMSGPALTTGVKAYPLNHRAVSVTTPARTVVDCFRFRNKLESGLALRALRDFRRLRKGDPEEIWAHAEALRMSTVIRPHWASLL